MSIVYFACQWNPSRARRHQCLWRGSKTTLLRESGETIRLLAWRPKAVWTGGGTVKNQRGLGTSGCLSIKKSHLSHPLHMEMCDSCGTISSRLSFFFFYIPHVSKKLFSFNNLLNSYFSSNNGKLPTIVAGFLHFRDSWHLFVEEKSHSLKHLILSFLFISLHFRNTFYNEVQICSTR